LTSYRELLGLGTRELVSLVGGGGKSTLMFALGNELAADGRRVVLTTTTKLGREQAMAAPTVCWSAASTDVDAALDKPGPVMLVTGGDDHKVTGPGPGAVSRLFTNSGIDFIIVEADGAKGRPLKAPADFEPVIPTATTTVVIVMGIDAVGKRIADAVHRVDRASALSGLPPAHVLTAKDCALIITHRCGILQSCPPDSRIVVAITKVDATAGADISALRNQLSAHSRIAAVVAIPKLTEQP
jgi:molybdenum cofactor cytidylyltransferase